MDSNLIYDIGAHKGEDTAFYLSKGFRVIAVEANPSFCGLIKEQHRQAISSGALTIVNIAIAKKSGSLDFFIDEGMSVWGTTNADWVERNRRLGRAGKITTIRVDCAPLSDVVRQYGAPRYCKIDIEGNDTEAVASLEPKNCPKFISLESEKLDWDRLLNEFKLLEALGYRKYKVIDQSTISFHRCPNPPLEGAYIDFKFEEGSSGLFGDELPGRWLSVLEAIEVYKNIFRGYSINGDAGLFVGGRKSFFNTLGELQERAFRFKGFKNYLNPAKTFPAPGWYDTHASK